MITTLDSLCTLGACSAARTTRWRCDEHFTKGAHRPPPPRYGQDHHEWSATPRYETAHQYVTKTRGRAAEHQCAHCESVAATWAYDHADPNELTATKLSPHDVALVVAYSRDPDHYIPLCRPCHNRFDRRLP